MFCPYTELANAMNDYVNSVTALGAKLYIDMLQLYDLIRKKGISPSEASYLIINMFLEYLEKMVGAEKVFTSRVETILVRWDNEEVKCP